ncbi:MAG: hypothetical protein KDA88_08275 [Planctomycetaceae bacterium]|nr:hypothetical protein [Planctomycetaceae bacterium]MCB9951295.1 hypothetical protein [Planctomycetaceae bacterium]
MPTRLRCMALVMSTMLVSTAFAQYPQGAPTYQQPASPYVNASMGIPTQMAQPVQAYNGVPSQGKYPQLSSALYPAPVQNVPSWQTQTVITNQAFAPHEMLYPHDYKAMYGPFYYKVRGHWFWTPFGMRQHENWKLEGTTVEVKYRARTPLLSRFN